MNILRLLRSWTLPISMATGVASYFIVARSEAIKPFHPFLHEVVDILQPLLIFAMLFLSFCKIKPSQLTFASWQWKLLLIQGGLFVGLGHLFIFLPKAQWTILIEAAMLCFICPTATAAIVVTGKLGGNTGSLTTYTILGNLNTALLVPLMVPFLYPENGTAFLPNFLVIMGRVFPLLFCPFVLAVLLQQICPKLVETITSVKDLAFHLWAFALAIAMAITTRSLVHSTFPLAYEIGVACISLAACAIQFYVGKRLGLQDGEPISGAQALGQKNTIFAIWMGYTFLTPVTSLAGGFYSIWHNVYNSYQLYKKEKHQRIK